MEDLYEYLKQHNACSKGVDWCRANELKTTAEAWDALCKSTHYDWLVWLALRATTRGAVFRFLEETVKRAIHKSKTTCTDPAWNRWADAWLSGEDRSEDAAEEAATWVAYQEAWEASAWAAWLSGDDRSEEAAREAVAAAVSQWPWARAEVKTQADWWRKEPNPFKENLR